MAWFRICDGGGTTDDYDNLVFALNVTRVLSEPLGEDAVAVVHPAQMSCLPLRDRFLRVGRFAPDSESLKAIPPALDLYDEFLRVCTPLQMVNALTECVRRLEKGPK